MAARGILTWRQAGTGANLIGRLALGLERLALAAFIITILLLGYWRAIPLSWFSQSWAVSSQYQLVTLFNPQYRAIILYPSDIAAAVTITLCLLGRIAASITRQERAPLRFGPLYLMLPVIGMAALSALSATQAVLPILSLEIALHLLFLAALVIAIINLRPPLWAVAAPLALLLAIEGLLSLLQTLAQSTLLGPLLFNWSHNITAAQPEASIVQLPDGTRWLRAYGSLPHPNILGGLLCLAIPVVAGSYLRLPRRSLAAGWRAWLLLISLGLGLLALLLSFSRAAWLGVFIAALWAGLLLWQRRRVARHQPPVSSFAPQNTSLHLSEAARRLAFLCLLGAGLLVSLVATLGPAIQSRLLLSNSTLEQRSLSERAILLEAGATFFTQHPWLGVGAGNMPLVELSYPPTRNIGESTHNVPIAIAVETGLFGMLLWLLPPIVTLWYTWERRFALSAAGLAASVALIALSIVAQLDHYLWTQPTGSLIWWLAVTLVALWSERSSNEATIH
ncbi:MAG TPA: O-antigen ligase family protein [Ktedonobacterales bacterium]|jgi:O-antigen ligase